MSLHGHPSNSRWEGAAFPKKAGRFLVAVRDRLSVGERALAAPGSADNALAAFLAFLAEEQVTARTARLYLAHLQRLGAWLREQYRADLLEAIQFCDISVGPS
jgi:hypothetical protein